VKELGEERLMEQLFARSSVLASLTIAGQRRASSFFIDRFECIHPFIVRRSSFIVPFGDRLELLPPFVVHRSSFIVHRSGGRACRS
jgi:hypothetical protein